ncbi:MULTISPECIES: histidinol-phosphate transaminase [unclassified Roseateles]|uniref:histidinol-phosphate transaminase n=1 Tax=unclassified Roseateles TaxID=2626991 RepID=UPI0006F998FB|nr:MULTISPECIES: histidinol-phosphate transaminase [unclassified Roseateles]KQW42900.1 histidinol-phosphate aminotransferase [Pelomonas sp. Root405]KRA69578.1 histidinol-phosphate aminotransferase [Pelomonas sp. Root662]
MTAALDKALAQIRPDVRAAHAYVVQPSAGVIKLDAMENPYRLPPELQQALGERLGALALNRYPAERTAQLARALARHAGVGDDVGVTLGNGSDELIGLLTIAVARPGATVLAPVPGFVMYEALAGQQRLEFIGVPLRADDFQLDEGAMLAAIDKHQPALIHLAYPNNPTATLWDAAVIERIAKAAPGVVVMDEAYQPFASADSLALMARQPNVLVMRTMSKFGLAGVRIGYLLGAAELVNQIEKLRPPYNISVLNAEAAFFALEHAEVYAAQAAELRQQRERLFAALQAMPGITPWPSQGNMILARVQDAAATFAALKAHGVLIKNVSALHPLLANCVRLTVGTPDENTSLLQALEACLS